MAILGIVPGTEGVLALKSRWDAMFRTKANEEMAIAQDFDTPTGDVTMEGDFLYVRIIPTSTAYVLATTAEAQDTLTYNESTVTRVSLTPRFIYSPFAIPDHMRSRLGDPDIGKLETGLRIQCLSAIDADVDTQAATLFQSISTVKGPFNADLANILDVKTALQTNAKEHVKQSSSVVHLKYHPSQIRFLNAIAQFANADARGDAENPNVKGFFIKAQGMTFNECGAVTLSGATYYNCAFARSAFMLAWWTKPKVKPPQDFELAKLFHTEADYAVGEIFDEDAVAWRSAQ